MRTKAEQNNLTRRVLCLWLPSLEVDRHRRMALKKNSKDFNSIAIVIVRNEYGRRTVVSACSISEELGVVVGRPLSDALALYSKLLVAEIDPIADKKELVTLANWCGRYSPFVALDECRVGIGGGGLWLDITGCSHLFGGEEMLLKDITTRLSLLGWNARGVIADTPGTAWALAHFGELKSQVIKPGGQQDAIVRLPLIALRLPISLVENLNKVGLRHIESLLPIARAPLRARFGADVNRRLNQALGLESEPISSQIHYFPDLVRFILSDPISTSFSILQVIECLLERLMNKLELKSLGVRKLRLLLYRVDGKLEKLIVGTSQVNRNKNFLLKLFFERFNKFVLDSGVDVITLEATDVDSLRPQQFNLIIQNDQINTKLSELVDRLVNRFGSGAVIRRSLHESYSPERSEPALSVVSNLNISKVTRLLRRPLDDAVTVRPICLLQRPEWLELMTLCENSWPLQFRWRRLEVKVRRINGPERIAPEWWRIEDQHKTRDYFRIEDVDGRRYWLFKEITKESNKKPSWYLHGLFS
jgi:protein ImuB